MSSIQVRDGQAGAEQMVEADSLVRLRPRSETEYLSFDAAVLVTARNGFIYPQHHHGLFIHRTRLLCRYCYLANGCLFQPVTLSLVCQNRWSGYYIQNAPKPGVSRDAAPTLQTLELRVLRELTTAGLREQLELTNYSQDHIEFEFAIELAADFADQDETRTGKRVQHGTIRERFSRCSATEWKLKIEYQATHEYRVPGEAGAAEFRRGVEIQIKASAGEVAYGDGTLRRRIALDPLKSARLELWVRQIFPDGVPDGPFRNPNVQSSSHPEDGAESLRSPTSISLPGIKSDGLSAVTTISRAARDLAALRMYCLDRADGWIPAAGLPEYLAFFGRDVLITAMQSAMLDTHLMRGALDHLARWQTQRTNDWRDEQPGRMLHQAEIGPLGLLNYTPLGLYYGTIRPRHSFRGRSGGFGSGLRTEVC